MPGYRTGGRRAAVRRQDARRRRELMGRVLRILGLVLLMGPATDHPVRPVRPSGRTGGLRLAVWRQDARRRWGLTGHTLNMVGLALLLVPLGGWLYSQYYQTRMADRYAAAPSVPIHAHLTPAEPAAADPTAADPTAADPASPEPSAADPAGSGEDPVIAGAPATVLEQLQPPPEQLPDWFQPIERDLSSGFPAMRIEIPTLGVEAYVLDGVTETHLRQGPGHYPGTALPGEWGNAGIAAHRTTYGAWFRHLHRLQPGELIRVVYPDATVAYAVERVFVVAPTQWSVVAPTDYPALTLTTCDPPGSAAQRLVVRARLVGLERIGTDAANGRSGI